jgi:hypothetical protein
MIRVDRAATDGLRASVERRTTCEIPADQFAGNVRNRSSGCVLFVEGFRADRGIGAEPTHRRRREAPGIDEIGEVDMRLLTRYLAAAAVVGAWQITVPAPNAFAQAPPPRSPQASPSTSPDLANPAAITDEKLDKTAAAIKRVIGIQQDFEERLASASEPDRKNIENDAVKAVTKAINDQGLSVDEYSTILDVAQNDPDVRQKIVQRIKPSGE